jgi:hypothetical protein
VAHICNSSYSGGRDQEDLGLKPALANCSWDPILKKVFTKKDWQSGLRYRPWVQTPILQTKKKKKKKTKPKQQTTTFSWIVSFFTFLPYFLIQTGSEPPSHPVLPLLPECWDYRRGPVYSLAGNRAFKKRSKI